MNLQPRKQFLLKRPEAAKVLELTVDPRAYWIYTNTPIDNDRMQQALQGRTFDQALTLLTHEGEPS